MTEVSFNPSTKGPSQGHQAMGSAGSFWLPPKMRAETFNSNLQKFSTSSNKVSEKGNNHISHSAVSKDSPKANFIKPNSGANYEGSGSSVKASKFGNLSFHGRQALALKGQSSPLNSSTPSKVIPQTYAHSNPTSMFAPQSKISGSVSQQIPTVSGQNVSTRLSKIVDLGFGGTQSATSYSILMIPPIIKNQKTHSMIMSSLTLILYLMTNFLIMLKVRLLQVVLVFLTTMEFFVLRFLSTMEVQFRSVSRKQPMISRFVSFPIIQRLVTS